MKDEHIAELDAIVDQPPASPDPIVDPNPPADKEPHARDDKGKFAAKDKPTDDPAKPDDKPKDKEDIPLAAHIEERKQWKQERAQWLAEKRAFEERLAKLEKPPEKTAEQVKEPEYSQDPKAYVDTKVNRALEELKKGTTEAQQTAQQAHHEAQLTRFFNTVAEMEANFVSETPDYADARTFARQARFQQLQMLAPDATEDQLIAHLQQEEQQLALSALRRGANPAQLVYNYAKTIGYAKKADPAPPADVPTLGKPPKQLAPDQTLGSSGNSPALDATNEQEDPFDMAFKSMFKKAG